MASFVPEYPKLAAHLKSQLDAITPSVQGDLKYYPCLVRLKDGTEVDRVYLVAHVPDVGNWGAYPGQDAGKLQVRIEDVASLAESPSRLPAKLANELYLAGESGMGYIVFTVVFKRRLGVCPCRRNFVMGSAIDFIDYPRWRGPHEVIAVLPHLGRRGKHFRQGPKYFWCLYSE
jgi:hypothetical protein